MLELAGMGQNRLEYAKIGCNRLEYAWIRWISWNRQKKILGYAEIGFKKKTGICWKRLKLTGIG